MEFLELAESNEETAREIFTWRRDPAVAQASLHSSLPDWETFFSQFNSEYFQTTEMPSFFLREDFKRISFVRFRPFERNLPSFVKALEISVMVIPEKRHQGVGLRTLKKAEEIAKKKGLQYLFAQVRPENVISKKLFMKAGYEFVETCTRMVESVYGREPVEVEIYRLTLTPQPKRKRIFLVAEIGSNWIAETKEKSFLRAEALIKAAADAGVNAVKFQTFRAKKVYAASPGKARYMAEREQDIMEILTDLEMAYEDIPRLALLAKTFGLEFMSTPFSIDDFDAVDPYVSFHKVASYEIAYFPLLEKIALSKKPVFLSTGASFLSEIAFAVRFLQKHGCSDITILQCTAAYPAQPESMNMRALETLSSAFGLPVGLSDHSLDCTAAPVLAVAFGASVIEKHITLHRSLPGPDHIFSIEPKELKMFVEKIRYAEKMVGSGEKRVLPQEEELFAFAKRSLQATKPINVGEIFSENVNMEILRPGSNRKGAHPSFAPLFEGRKSRRDICAGDGIQVGDIL